jgi:Neurotransmitter-gated ion-channel ligand binding domain
MKPISKLFIIISSLLFTQVVMTKDLGLTLPSVTKPVEVKIALFIEDIARVNPMEQTIELDGTLSLEWFDPRFVSDSEHQREKQYFTGPFLGQTLTLNQIWFPLIEIVNSRKSRDIEAQALIISGNGVLRYIERFNVELFTTMDFKQFPFDEHRFTIMMRSFIHDSNQLKLKPWKKKEGIAQTSQLAEWDVKKINASILPNTKGQEMMQNDKYIVNLTLKRHATFYLWKNILPIILIVMLSWSVLWMSGESLGQKLTVCVSTVIAIIAYQWVILHNIPKVPYPVFMSVLISFSFIFTCIVLGTIVLLKVIECHVRYELFCNVETFLRLGLPIFYFLMLIVLAIIYA